VTRSGFLFTAVAGLLCLALAGAAICILGVPLGPYSPYLDILAQFAPQAGFGAAIAAIIYGAMRLKVMSALALVTAVASIVFVWPSRDIEACAPGAGTHRVAFLNVWDGNLHIEDTIDYLATLDADVIVMVEFRPRFRQAITRLSGTYPYQTACADGCSAFIISRLPLTEVTAKFSRPTGPRSLAAVEIPYTDGTLTLVGVHLYRPWPFHHPELQEREAHTLAQALAPVREPRLVLGDFNAVPWGAIVKRVAREAALTPLTGVGTWRTNLPAFLRLPIDQALAGSGISCATKRVGRRVGSDHRPVIVDFAF